MKKTIIIALGLVVLLAACDRKAFVKKLVGNWKLDQYWFDGLNKTVYFDTTFREWNLVLNEDQLYSKSWKNYYFAPDSVILIDTIGYDSVSMAYITASDTFHFVDTTIVPHVETGTWELINSEEDLQLRNDSSASVEIFRILQLDKNNLKLRKGNEEFYYGK